MIVKIEVENFRSIKELSVFNLGVENSKQHLINHVAYPDDKKLGALRSAGLYGANASGKSNVLLAFAAIRFLACSSGDLKEDKDISCYEPYLLNEESKTKPVSFSIEFFTKEGVRYLYQISFNKDSILTESLDYFPVRQTNIFKRGPDDNWETISFGNAYKGGSKRIPFFKNNSYLSIAGGNAAAPAIIRDAYKFLRSKLIHLGLKDRVLSPHLNVDEINCVAKFLSLVDTGVSNIQLEKKEISEGLYIPPSVPPDVREIIEESNKLKFMFAHNSESGNVELFTRSMESDGTQKLFSLLPMLLDIFANGSVLVVDELDSSLHPHLAELIIKLFNDSEVNTQNAQLIFSTHNINLMAPEKLRRDQIWFTEKNNGSTQLYSLDEFDKNTVKSFSPFAKWYDEGRFGALPNLDYLAVSDLLRNATQFFTLNDKE